MRLRIGSQGLTQLRRSYLKAHPRSNNNRIDYGTMKDLEFVPGRGVLGCKPELQKANSDERRLFS